MLEMGKSTISLESCLDYNIKRNLEFKQMVFNFSN